MQARQKFYVLSVILFLFFPFHLTARANADKANDSEHKNPKVESNDVSSGDGFWFEYWHYINRRSQELKTREDDFWGVQSLTCPEGVFSLKFIVNCKRADSRYRNDGSRGPIVSPISFPDPFGTNGDFMNVNINVKGSGCGYVFRLFYAVSDPLDVFINFQFQTQELEMDIDFKPGTSSHIGIRTEEDF